MLPLDPVKELVQITRVKFHNPSMAFRIWQVEKNNTNQPKKPKTKTKLNTQVPESIYPN